MTTHREFATATPLPNGDVLITGGTTAQGQSAQNSAELYDPSAGIFTAICNSMNATRAFHTATLLPNGQVLIAGGSPGSDNMGGLPNGTSLSSAELYAPAAGSFTATSNSMTAARAIATATLLPNGEVLIAGGENNSGKPESSTDLYTP